MPLTPVAGVNRLDIRGGRESLAYEDLGSVTRQVNRQVVRQVVRQVDDVSDADAGGGDWQGGV